MDDTNNPPDWCKWVIACYNFFIVMFSVGLNYGVWLIRDDFRSFYDEYNYGQGGIDIDWAVYINIAVTFFLGILAAAISNIGKKWPRCTVFGGAVISTLGLVVSWLATNAGVLCITYGFVTGIGFGLMLTPSLGMIPRYFDKRGLDMAMSVALLGASMYLFIIPPLFDHVKETYGKRGMYFILACLNAQSAWLAVAFLRPIKQPDPPSGNEGQAEGDYDDEIDGASTEGKLTAIAHHLDLFLFQKPMFVTMVIAMFFIGAGHNVLILHLQQGAMDRGANDSELQMLPIYYGIAMVIGSLCYGISSLPCECCGFADGTCRLYTNKIRLLKFCTSLLVVGIAGVLSFLATSFAGFIAVTIVIGFGSGFYLPLMVVMVKVFVHRGEGRQNHAKSRWRVTAALGFAFTAFGIGAVVGLPVADLLNERLDNYNSSYFLAGAAMLFAFFIVMIRGIVTARERKIRNTTGTMDDTNSPIDWWKWAIACYSFFIVMSTVGLNYGIWLIRDDFRSFYDEYNYGQGGIDIDWAVYINIAVTFFLGILAAGISNIGKEWPRFTVFGGVVISTLGLVVSWLATSAGVLCITYGFVTGIGFGLMLTPSLGMIPRYFDRRGLDMAMSVALLGASMYLFITPPLFDHVKETYGRRGMYLILAGLNAQSAWITVAFLLPITQPDPPPGNEGQAEGDYDDEIDGAATERKLTALAHHLDLDLFQKPMFITMVIAMFFIGAGHNVLILHLQQGAMDRGANDSELQILPIYLGAAMVVGSLSYGISSLPCECCCFEDRRSRLSTNTIRLFKFGVALFVVGIAGVLSFLATSFAGFIAVTIVIGLGSGVYLPLMVVMVKVFVHRGEGRQNHAKSRWRVTAALGFAFTAFGIGAIVGLPVADLLNGILDNYNSAYILAGAVMFVALFFVMIRGTAIFRFAAGRGKTKSYDIDMPVRANGGEENRDSENVNGGTRQHIENADGSP
ncbi:uncharacterized protein [Ptychodera flava]